MAPVETSAIAELTGEVRELRADLRVFQTRLMGDDQSEDDQGRIPRIEAAVADHEIRIARGEHLRWAANGITWFCGVIMGAAGAAYSLYKVFSH
jgi:hypothetical protein